MVCVGVTPRSSPLPRTLPTQRARRRAGPVAVASVVLALVSFTEVASLRARVAELPAYTMACSENFTSNTGATSRVFFPCAADFP